MFLPIFSDSHIMKYNGNTVKTFNSGIDTYFLTWKLLYDVVRRAKNQVIKKYEESPFIYKYID